MSTYHLRSVFFFFNAPAPTEIYTLSLHDALPISVPAAKSGPSTSPNTPTATLTHMSIRRRPCSASRAEIGMNSADRKSTRLNSSHVKISYAVFCLKKKKKTKYENIPNNQNMHIHT